MSCGVPEKFEALHQKINATDRWTEYTHTHTHTHTHTYISVFVYVCACACARAGKRFTKTSCDVKRRLCSAQTEVFISLTSKCKKFSIQ